MDQFIIEESNKGRIQVSYSSFDNPYDQYHRNANLPTQSNDLIKLPVFLYALEEMDQGYLDKDEAFKLREARLLVNEEGMFGLDDIGRFVTTKDLLLAIAQFGDNAATNILLNRLDRAKFTAYLKSHHFNNLYLLKDLDDRKKNITLNASNFTTSGDLVGIQKSIINDLRETRGGRIILKDFLLPHRIDNSLNLEDLQVVKWNENTQVAKGFNIIAIGEKGFVLTVLVSNFKNENEANILVENAQNIFFSSYVNLSSN